MADSPITKTYSASSTGSIEGDAWNGTAAASEGERGAVFDGLSVEAADRLENFFSASRELSHVVWEVKRDSQSGEGQSD